MGRRCKDVSWIMRGWLCLLWAPSFSQINGRLYFSIGTNLLVPLLCNEHYAGTTVVHAILTVTPVRHHGLPQTLHGWRRPLRLLFLSLWPNSSYILRSGGKAWWPFVGGSILSKPPASSIAWHFWTPRSCFKNYPSGCVEFLRVIHLVVRGCQIRGYRCPQNLRTSKIPKRYALNTKCQLLAASCYN